jgi:hypothetical protein
LVPDVAAARHCIGRRVDVRWARSILQHNQGEGLMKRTTKHMPAADRRPEHTRILTGADLAQVTGGDVYMHDPKGSNNRLNEGG